MLRKIFQAQLVLMVLALAACVTVNIYFPAAKVEKAAERIVDDVYGDAPQDKNADPAQPEGEQKSALEQFLALMGPAPALAQDATSVSNAAIRGLKGQIASNHQQLAPFYASGNVGVANNGLVALRNTDGLSMPQVAGLKQLVAADNAARQKLYAEVAQALNIDPSQQGKVAGIFANQWRSKAAGGWWVQDDSGAWRQK